MNLPIHPKALSREDLAPDMFVTVIYFTNDGVPLHMGDDLEIIHVLEIDPDQECVTGVRNLFNTPQQFGFDELALPADRRAGWKLNACLLQATDAMDLKRSVRNRIYDPVGSPRMTTLQVA